MKKPNIYKAKIGLMDTTLRELTIRFCKQGFKVTVPEVSAAIHGGRQAKHAKIRRLICESYDKWKAEAVKTYNIDYKNIL